MNPLAKSTRLLLTATCLWVCFTVVELQAPSGTYQCMKTSGDNHVVKVNVQTQYPLVRIGGGPGSCESLSSQGTAQDPHELTVAYNFKTQTSSCAGQFFANGTVIWPLTTYNLQNEIVGDVVFVSCNLEDSEKRIAVSSNVISVEIPYNNLTAGSTSVFLEILSDYVPNKVVTQNDILQLGWTAYFRVRLEYKESSSVVGVSPYDVYVSPDSTFTKTIQMIDSEGCTVDATSFQMSAPFAKTTSAPLTHTMTSGEFEIRQFIGSQMLYFKMKFDTCVTETEPQCILSCGGRGRRKREAEVRNDTWYFTNIFIEPYEGAYSDHLAERLAIEEQCFTDILFLVPNVVLACLVCLATITAVYFFLRLRNAINGKRKSTKASKTGSQVTKSTFLS